MNEQRQREEAIFEAALELSGRQRDACLEAACGHDADLRRRIERLLQAHERAAGVLEQSPAMVRRETTPSSLPPTEQAGDRIGRYRLQQQIGEGGCGVVWMAEQESPVRRRVALKVIKLGMDTRQVIARFEAERQALALMDHPNIAKVLDAGATNTGRPYFVMELVCGVRITDYCDQANLPTEQRLDLFIQVCQAIQHAHQKGIIHRDIKPSNILVADHDGVPVAKVIDFGIAKATTDQRLTNKTLFTAFEQFLGTPAYMSPEQANLSGLDLDTRTDIYSLGVLLYELLTGKTPFDAKELLQAGLDEMRRTIREKEPARPSTRLSTMQADDLTTTAWHRHTDAPKLVHLVRGDLDWIVMKCLEKDRTRRYETANGLALDVQRHLNNELVAARPPSFRYRTGQVIRKYKRTVIAAAAVLLALCAGLVVSTVLYVREKTAWASESAQRAKAQTEAAKNAQTAKFLAEMLSAINPELAMGRDVTVLTEMLERATKRVDTELQDQPEVEASLRTAIGHVHGKLGQYAAALPHLEKALAIRERLLGLEHLDTLETASRLTASLRGQGRLAEAEALDVRAVEVSKRVWGPDHRATLTADWNLAQDFLAQRKFARAEARLRETLAISQRVLGSEDPVTLMVQSSLATICSRLDKHAEAEGLHSENLKIKQRVLGAEHPDTLMEMSNLASAFLRRGKFTEAETLYRQAWEIEQRIHGPEHPNTLVPMHNLAVLYSQHASRPAEAEALLRQEWEISQRVFGLGSPLTLETLNALAVALYRQGKLAEAEKLNRNALETSQRALGLEHPTTLQLMHNLAAIVSKTPENLADAKKLFQQALALRNQVLGPEHRDTLLTAAHQFTLLRDQKKFAEAEALSRQTLETTRLALGPGHQTTLTWMNNLGSVLKDAGQADDAQNVFRQTLAIARRALAPDHSETLRSLRELASITETAGLWDETLALWSERWPLETNNTILPLATAAMQAWFGKTAEHAATCVRFFKQVESLPEAFAAERAAKAFCVLPSTNQAALSQALNLARRAVAAGKGEGWMPNYQLALGMAEYRNGHLPEAEQVLATAERSATDDSHVQALAQLFRAMSLFRQDRVEEARRLFADPSVRILPLPKDEKTPFANGGTQDDVIVWLAYKEATALLGGATDRDSTRQ